LPIIILLELDAEVEAAALGLLVVELLPLAGDEEAAAEDAAGVDVLAAGVRAALLVPVELLAGAGAGAVLLPREAK
jgi:hypothetical protein